MGLGCAIMWLDPLEPRVMLSAGAGGSDLLQPESATVVPAAAGALILIQAGAADLPDAIISGDGQTLRLTVLLTNQGDETPDIGVEIRVLVFGVVRNEQGQEVSPRILLVDGMFDVGGLGPAESRSVTVEAAPPRGWSPLPAQPGDLPQTVSFLLSPFGGNPVSVATDGNTLFAQTLQVTSGYVDPAITLDQVRQPESVLRQAGKGVAKLKATLSNLGNVAGNDVDTFDVVVRARRIDDPNITVELTRQTVSLEGMAPGKSRSLKLTADLANVFDDRYQGEVRLEVVIDPPSDADDDNNSDAAEQTLQVDLPFTEASVSLGKLKLPDGALNDQAHTFVVPVLITNEGNVPLPDDAQTTITISVGSVQGNVSNIVLMFVDAALGGLKPGKSATTNVPVTINAGVAPDGYRVSAAISISNTFDDELIVNNLAQSEPFTIERAVVDIAAASLALLRVKPLSAGVGGTVKAKLTLTNVGNARAAADLETVLDQRRYRLIDVDDPTPIQTVVAKTANLRPGKSIKVTLTFLLTPDLNAGTYELSALLRPAGGTDDPGNDLAVAEQTVELTGIPG